MAGRSAGNSGEFPTDYIDIVNEINDFIASLDAPPLSEHTKQLVGNKTKPRTPAAPPASAAPVPLPEDTAAQRQRALGNHHGAGDDLSSAYHRRFNDVRGYHENQSSCGDHVASTTAACGDYDNPGLLIGTGGFASAQHRDAPRVAEKPRSRHASGERREATLAHSESRGVPISQRQTGQHKKKHAAGVDEFDRVKLSGSAGDSYENKAHPFPSEQELDQTIAHYDYVESDRSRSTGFGDYSDCSSFSDTASTTSSSGGTCDSDSGCYSHYQQPRSNAAPKPSFYKDISQSLDSSNFRPPPSSPYISGHKGSNGSPAPVWLRQQHHQPHLQVGSSSQHPQSPDRLSAEFRCDSDDLSFQQVGSSAHTLASGKQYKEPSYYQEPRNIPRPLPATVNTSLPQVPKSPVPQRRSPSKLAIRRDDVPSSPVPTSSPNSAEVNYSVILKSEQSPPCPPVGPQKLNLKKRWPPASSEPDDRAAGAPAGRDQHAVKLSKPKPFQHPLKDSTTQAAESPRPQQHQSPANPSASRLPDLSVLISELRSVAASRPEQSSPTSAYKSTARSESRSQTQSPIQCSRQPQAARSEPQSPVSKPRSPTHHHHHHTDQPQVGSRSAGQSPARLQPQFLDPHPRPRTPVSGADTPTFTHHHQQHQHHQQQGPNSPTRSAHANTSTAVGDSRAGVLRYKSASPEHDYEPIETLQLEVPATPRPQPKFPHPQGHSAMADTGAHNSQGQAPKHVKALFNFKGENNDELCFKKGDIITVTQCVEGGWWEGTLNGRTGWFPSNYTKEVKADLSYKNHKSGEVPIYKRESMQLYHNMVLKNVIETEKAHVEEMSKVLQSYIKPILATNILSPPEYSTLIGNMEEIIAFQQSFLSALEDCEKLPLSQRRIGGIFMQFAPTMKELHSSYCANHPQAVSLLQKRRDELSKFVESQGAASPGAQALTTILSKPFVRLDKYPSLLKELERHVEESHPDRGDTQRAIAVYKNIANSCLDIRKLKEMEHEIITSTIQGWEGEEISKLGEVIHLSQVKMITQTGEKFERIFVLFPSCLVMLSMSSRLSSYQYEGKIPLSGLCATPSENTDSFQNAFEISGPMIEKITVLCGTKLEVSAWLDILRQQLSQSGHPPSSSSSSSASSSSSQGKPQSMQMHMISTCQPSVSTVTPAKTAQISSSSPSSATANNILNNNNVNSNNPAPCGPAPPHFPAGLLAKGIANAAIWSLTCLRPSPPLRPMLMCREEVLKSPRAARKSAHKRKPVRTYSGEETDWHSKNDPKVYNEDAFILQVIEAYCNSVKTRHTVNSCKIEVAKKKPSEGGKAILNSPQILLAEEEKIFDETEQQERTVVDTVYALQDRVKELEQEQRRLRLDLEEERRCRRKLEVLVKQVHFAVSSVDTTDSGGGGGLSDTPAIPPHQDGISTHDTGS